MIEMWAPRVSPSRAKFRELELWKAENPHPNEVTIKYKEFAKEYGSDNIKMYSTLGADNDVTVRIVRYVWEIP